MIPSIIRYKEERLVRKSIRDISPKTYAVDSFDVKCRIIFSDGSIEAGNTPEIVIFDERGGDFAATYINCPIGSENRNKIPKQVLLKNRIFIITSYDAPLSYE